MLPTMTIFLTISSGLFILVTCPQQCFIVFLVWSVAVLLKRTMQDYETGHLFLVDFGASILTAVCLWYSLSEASGFVKFIIVIGLILLMFVFEQESAHGMDQQNEKHDEEVEAESRVCNPGKDGDDSVSLADGSCSIDTGSSNASKVVSKRTVDKTSKKDEEKEDEGEVEEEKEKENEDEKEKEDEDKEEEDREENEDEEEKEKEDEEEVEEENEDEKKEKKEEEDEEEKENEEEKTKEEEKDEEKKEDDEEEKKEDEKEEDIEEEKEEKEKEEKEKKNEDEDEKENISNISGQPSINVHMENISNGQMLTDKASKQEMQSKDEATTDTYVEGHETEDNKPAQDFDEDKGQQIKSNDNICDEDAVDGTYNYVADDDEDEKEEEENEEEYEDEEEEGEEENEDEEEGEDDREEKEKKEDEVKKQNEDEEKVGEDEKENEDDDEEENEDEKEKEDGEKEEEVEEENEDENEKEEEVKEENEDEKEEEEEVEEENEDENEKEEEKVEEENEDEKEKEDGEKEEEVEEEEVEEENEDENEKEEEKVEEENEDEKEEEEEVEEENEKEEKEDEDEEEREDNLMEANTGDSGGYNGGGGNVDGYRRSKGELNVEVQSQDTMTDVQQKIHEYVDRYDGPVSNPGGNNHAVGYDEGKEEQGNQDVSYTREANVRSHDVLQEDENKSTYIETMNTAHTVHGGMGHKMNVTDSNVTAPLLSNISGQPSINVHMENVSNGQILTGEASKQEKQSKDEAATDNDVEGQETEDNKPAQDVDDKGQQRENDNDLCEDDVVDRTYNDVVDDDEDKEEEEEEEVNKHDNLNDGESSARCRLKRVARDLKLTKYHMRGIENSLEEMKANSSGNSKEHNENFWQNIKQAARQGNYEDFRRLVKAANVELKRVDKNGNNLLNIACIGGNPDIVKELLVEYMFDIDFKGEKERNPVMIAASKGHWKVFKLLQDYGCSPMMHDVDGNTEIQLACEGGNLEIVAYLFRLKKVHVNARNSYGRTPLMFASKNGKMEVVEYLANVEGCDLKAVDKDGDDSIKFADLEGHRDIVEFLQGKISKNSDKVHK